MAGILDEVGEGRPGAIYSSGKFVGVLITPAEYYRLRKLSRVVSWFRTAGLDLVTADEAAIADFVRRFREGPASAAESVVVQQGAGAGWRAGPPRLPACQIHIPGTQGPMRRSPKVRARLQEAPEPVERAPR